MIDDVRRVLAYHERTKHHLRRYADSPDHLDWASQPDPFRTYAGAPYLELPLLADALVTPYGNLYRPGAVRARPLDVNGLAVLFELALGLSAWKEYRGSRWALRCNPSSGNLHPTEGYAVTPDLPGLAAGVHHYVSRDHRLEQRCSVPRLEGLPSGSFLIGLSSIHWREAWKYGERAYRYCQHDVGHAVAAIRYAAAALGWSVALLEQPSDADVSAVLGLDRDDDFAAIDPLDREHPDCLLLVSSRPSMELLQLSVLIEAISRGTWRGHANLLSPSHVSWDTIEVAVAATSKPETKPGQGQTRSSLPPLPRGSEIPAATLIRQRRSCLALDRTTSIPAATFFQMLDHLLPRSEVPPWDVLPWQPQLHPVIFVHRIDDLTPGLYLLERDGAVHDRIRAGTRPSFRWARVDGCPDHLRLFLLEARDYREYARTVSCHQEIASDGAFSTGMLADFEQTIQAHGPWWYRRLFWESGVLGQVLYLEAEAAGVRGTGIGCYFDDVFHQLLGLQGPTFQSLYHFTVGGPVDDPRLRTIAPYAHLSNR